MSKVVELRRHTDSDGDVLTDDGIAAAVAIGRRLRNDYALVVSSGAQRATQTAACILAGMGRVVPRGVLVHPGFRSEVEHRWLAAYREAGAGDLDSFRKVDPGLVESESVRFAAALRDVLEALDEGQRALVIGHSPMLEAAVLGLTGEIVSPLAKGGGVVLTVEDGSARAEPAD